jgi:hypothetical protein
LLLFNGRFFVVVIPGIVVFNFIDFWNVCEENISKCIREDKSEVRYNKSEGGILGKYKSAGGIFMHY